MNETDRHLLQIIRNHQNSGRPPTFAEVAEDAGYAKNSKSAVYRRLRNLRGIYVEWDDGSARSLRLIGESEEELPEDSSRELLNLVCLIASGLVELCESRSTWPPGKPYPESLRRGWNKLCIKALLDGKDFPRDFREALDLFRKPIAKWPIPFLPTELEEDDVLLIGDEVTDVCGELAISGPNVEDELDQQILPRAREICRLAEDMDAYGRFRRFLIEHAVVNLQDLFRASLDLPKAVSQLLQEAFEEIPKSVVWNEEIRLCRFCGWTLSVTRDAEWRCGKRLCYAITKGFTQSDGMRFTDDLRRVLRGIQRSTVVPGKAELSLAKRLAAAGVEVRLWPAYDAYDIHARFPSGEVWAIDVKDWENPILLANRINRFEGFPMEPSWDKAYYVFPDHRASFRPRYERAFRSAWKGQGDRVQCALERNFMLLVRKTLKGDMGDA